MKRVIIFFAVFLFASNIDFSTCYEKFKYIDDLIPVSKDRSVTFSKRDNYLFYDPFTGIYVVKSHNKRVVRLYSKYYLGWWMAGIKKDKVYGGTLAEDMKFLTLSKLSVNVPKNSVISDIFCRAYGVGNKGFLRGDYVKHFAKFGYWGDIGIDVDENLVVKYVDPFYTKIKPKEKILKINDKKATIQTYEKYVILGKINDIVKIQTNKGKYFVRVRKKVFNFTPLFNFGIVVDKNLTITKFPKKIEQKYYISPPAKLIKVNEHVVKTFKELKKILSFVKNVTITVEKNGIKLNIPLRK